MTLSEAQFERGNKKSQKNVEVVVTVYNSKGKVVEVSVWRTRLNLIGNKHHFGAFVILVYSKVELFLNCDKMFTLCFCSHKTSISRHLFFINRQVIHYKNNKSHTKYETAKQTTTSMLINVKLYIDKKMLVYEEEAAIWCAIA